MMDGVNGIRPTYTNFEGHFLMEIPAGIKITNQTPFLVNGVPVAISDVQYSAIDNFVQINTYPNKNTEKPVTRQVFMVRVRDKDKDPIKGSRVSVDGTYYHTDKQGEFQFLVTTDGVHQVDISHIDSLQKQPQLSVQLPEKQEDMLESLTLENADSVLEENISKFLEQHIKLSQKITDLVKLSAKKARTKEQEKFMKIMQKDLESLENALSLAKNTQENLKKEVLTAYAQIDFVELEKDSLTREKNHRIETISEEKKFLEKQRIQEAEKFQKRAYFFFSIFAGLCLALFVTIRVAQKIKQQNKKIRSQQQELRKMYHALQNRNAQLEDKKLKLTEQAGILASQKHETEKMLEQLKSTQSQLIHSEKMAGLGILTAGIAHEINNPVGFIYGGVESLEERLPELLKVSDKYDALDKNADPQTWHLQLVEIEKLKENLHYEDLKEDLIDSVKDIKIGAERTYEIVKGLRTFSRLDEGKYKTVDIHENIDSTLIILRSQYRNQVKIHKNYTKIPAIECSPGSINQVVMNILSNAIQAILGNEKGKGNITISTYEIPQAPERSICISIKDDGPGISEEIKRHIFDPFFTTKDVGKGTGLGLSICVNIIESHHGKLEVFSQIHEGTEFRIHLPIKQKGVS